MAKKCRWCGAQQARFSLESFCSRKCQSEHEQDAQRKWDSLTQEEKKAKIAAAEASEKRRAKERAEWLRLEQEKLKEKNKLLKIAAANHIINERIKLQFVNKKIGLEEAIQLQIENKKKVESRRSKVILLCKILFFHIYYPVCFIWFRDRENELNEKLADYLVGKD